MNKCIKNISKIIILLFFTLLFPNVVNAQKYSSEFINISDASYTHTDDEFSLTDVYFVKESKAINVDDDTLHGVLYGNITNLCGHYLSVYVTIDYYDKNYNIIARSEKTEKLDVYKENYIMNVGLYDKNFLNQSSIDDISYFKLNYYTIKGDSLNESDDSLTNTTIIKPSENRNYKQYEYVIDSYNVDIKVNEDNTYDITETIDAYFNVSKHGIFRTIPLTNTVMRLDGTKEKNRAKVSKLEVSDNYSTSRENNNYKIKIGSANVTLTGPKQYKISYNYNLGKDKSDNYDELYLNIIGSEWDTVIGNVTFTITMPKEFDSSKLGFSTGTKGSIENSKVEYNVDGNVITGSYNRILKPKEALTVRCELPEGYFVNAGYQTSITTILFFVIPIISLIIAILLWYLFGRDDHVFETVEFYPPEGFNSLEIGFLYKGTAIKEDVTSLLVYLANKGYLKINEIENNSMFSKEKSFEIIKLKEYDGDNSYEREFFNGLFRKKSKYLFDSEEENTADNSLTSVRESDLYNSFYKTMNKIVSEINTKTNKEKIFRNTKFYSVIVVLMIIVSYLTIMAIPTLEYGSFEELAITIFISAFYIPFYAIGFSKSIKSFFKIIWLGFIMVHSFAFFSSMPITSAIKDDRIFLFGFILGILCIAGMIACLKLMPKRTPYGNEILGRIKGFRNFLETAEKDKLEEMVMQDPNYFYNILPYTYVLGVSDKWISKFESISLEAPNWYSGTSRFNINSFGTFMNSTMTSAQSAMSSSPSSSSSSSGGGSSGGGSGGGGGGSW